ncbi:hypothetical protein GTW43_32030 [Streptomyces sp. SID5785]|uniref:hypothetical protein n=1 Tax=Streptomyces sp. SID5785 TaxID=2690309 RepID=UPI0013611DA6|nr:hypothetical protein [Streptomyces sp. SID5785]MZD09676.1 hypothetical protein [Streptomyces sp. SID5785]
MFQRTVKVVCAVPLLALALSGCQGVLGGGGGSEDSAAPDPARSPAGYGAVFLAVGECSSRGLKAFDEVPCRSERAIAKVLARFEGASADGPACPAPTDFVLHISENRPSAGGNGAGAVAEGYACMRNLEDPHPGDPGGGGGPRTVVGDCVRAAGSGQVRETPCDGSGEEPPQYRVTKAVTSRARCPDSTALYVSLGGTVPVGCAQRLRP